MVDALLKKMEDSHNSFFKMMILLYADGPSISRIKSLKADFEALNNQLMENRKMLDERGLQIDEALKESMVINENMKDLKNEISDNPKINDILQALNKKELCNDEAVSPDPRYEVYDEMFTPQPSSQGNREPASSDYKFSVAQLPPSPTYFSPSPNQYEEMEVGPTISYLSNEEFENVPGYMKGRLKVEAVNEMVDLFNQVFDTKYEFMKYPRNSLKSNEKIYSIFPKWKLQQKEYNEEKICTESDIQLLANVKLSKKEYNLITILRHVKKIRQSKIKDDVFYIVID